MMNLPELAEAHTKTGKHIAEIEGRLMDVSEIFTQNGVRVTELLGFFFYFKTKIGLL